MVRKKKRKTKRSYELPKEKSKPISNIGGYAMLIFGAKKIGKTSFLQHFGKVLFLMFEPGAKALSVYQETMDSWLKFKEYVKLLVKDKTFDTVVIDTADFAYDDCLRYVCTKLCIEHPSDEGYGKGWDAVKKEFLGEIKKLLRAGKGVVFVSHQKVDDIESRSGKVYSKIVNTLSGQARGIIEGLVDIWINYDYVGEKRYLTLVGDDLIDAGHRLNEPPDVRFMYKDGTPVKKVWAGNTSKEAFNNFMKAFNNELEKPKGGSVRLKKKKGKLKLRRKK